MSLGVAIIGSTGSVGSSAVDVIRAHPDRFHVVSLAAGARTGPLIDQMRALRPRFVAVRTKEAADAIRDAARGDVQVAWGPDGLVEAASMDGVDIALISVVGAVGIAPTIAALEADKRVALANKETLVAAGDLVRRILDEGTGELLPVDSEHVALHQCLSGADRNGVEKLVLTASGGPFRNAPIERIQRASVAEALNHPTWKMGGKITIDSATLMNKGLEVIEANRLFDIPYDRIDVVVHPQSIVHSMVEFVDGSLLAQLGAPDMRMPIQYALSYPDKLPIAWNRCSLSEIGSLTFEAPDLERFPSLKLAFAAGRSGGTMPCVLNAANEVAVQRFLAGECRFGDIAAIVEAVCASHTTVPVRSLEDVLAWDAWARERAERLLERLRV